MPYPQTSDHDLISDLRLGKPEALTEIFRRFWKQLYLTAFRKIQSHESAEEIVQELFAELWDKRDQILQGPLEELQLHAYLRAAVRNKSLNHIRKRIYDKKYWAYCQAHFQRSENSTHELAEYNDLRHQLTVAVSQLSVKTRKIFVLHKLQGVPVLEISRKFKLSEKAIGYHLTKSVKELKIYLRDFM